MSISKHFSTVIGLVFIPINRKLPIFITEGLYLDYYIM
jgi:hypothetical protein